MRTRYLRQDIRPYSVKTVWRFLYSNSRYAYQHKDVKNVAVNGQVLSYKVVVVVAKNIKRHFNDRYTFLRIIFFCLNL